MKADNGGRKGDELAMALYPIRSRAIQHVSEGPKFFCRRLRYPNQLSSIINPLTYSLKHDNVHCDKQSISYGYT